MNDNKKNDRQGDDSMLRSVHCSYILNIHIFQTESSSEFQTGFSLEIVSRLSIGKFSKLNLVWYSKLDLGWPSGKILVFLRASGAVSFTRLPKVAIFGATNKLS